MSAAEWLAYREMAERMKNEFRPEVSMKSLPAPDGYSAEICIRKVSNATVARCIIINKTTDQVQFDLGGWASPNVAEKKLIEALAALSDVVKLRKQAGKGNV